MYDGHCSLVSHHLVSTVCILHVLHIKSFVKILLVSQGSVPKVNNKSLVNILIQCPTSVTISHHIPESVGGCVPAVYIAVVGKLQHVIFIRLP